MLVRILGLWSHGDSDVEASVNNWRDSTRHKMSVTFRERARKSALLYKNYILINVLICIYGRMRQPVIAVDAGIFWNC
jgi:hypothetical protein